MEVKQVLHMKAGEGQESYAQNSTPQRLTIFMIKPIFEEIIRALLSRFKVADCIRIADLGCSSGPNTLAQVELIINIIDKICNEVNQKQPSTQFFLNDLECNDFNNTFKLLPSFYNQLGNSTNRKLGSCFIAAMPGSFYTRLFPKESLHFVCSSNSLHWLSQVPKGLVTHSGEPLNKRNIYITRKGSSEVHKAYFDQFEKDFSLFLRLRCEEMLPGGHLLITVTSEPDDGYNSKELIGYILDDMVKEGLVKEAELASFNLPLYAPTAKEVKDIVDKEGHFKVLHLQTSTRPWNHLYEEDSNKGNLSRGVYISKFIRAVFEPILASHFGDAIMDEVFNRYAKRAEECMKIGQGFFNQVIVSLLKDETAEPINRAF